ncbi:MULTISPECIES: 3-hydroxybutyrate dehydrogenase [unclassified Paenibacillus]|jgi:3-hydroxybutyrate dehydrogenase|uniref:3-hydroxybutyrate dehydrogenase n=1 Tax=unclassified Paenibacillus TaxID=185978 RepID=UPI002782C2A8|nr:MULTISPECIES: 3-hydroxybutyrate dehydrogenase [unclassified Paenibacillus]MDF2645743.1 3-hydroxybutyrate dehydrogenase [Paenibacillus sp.]MDQ0903789.1 3-hydroxybutyrate dehydrogenase [Paenibacillus sp. V4I7]MDQ0917737.1 3-hydroxybutyrate dehydrogenase [Paenibacillus sp. V4I5]
MTRFLENRVALITGAASGIGLEIARTYAREGAKVVISDINGEQANLAAQKLQQEGFEAIGVKCDVTQEQQFVEAIETVVQTYKRLDILVNNAGLQHVAPIEDFPVEKFEFMIKVMLTGAFIGIKHAFPIMKEQGFGRIINMASINGVIGFAGKAAYNSAKHGLIGLTKVAALEGAPHGITVNALCPGYVDTPLVRGQLQDLAKTRNVPLESVLEEVIYPLVPQRRLLAVEEIADYAMLIASDKLRGVTGASLLIDGGYTAQ